MATSNNFRISVPVQGGPTSVAAKATALTSPATVSITTQPTWWDALTPAQGTVIGGGFTFAAAVFGVLLGWWLLSGKVKDLKGAVDKSDELLRGHSGNVDRVLTEVGDKLSNLAAEIVSATTSLGKLRGDVGDLQSTALPEKVNEAALVTRDTVRDSWTAIRDKLEEIAAETLDGRKRAKYGRIDRRNYIDLIDVLSNDGRLGNNVNRYRQAAAIWARYRNGRSVATPADQAAMIAHKQEIIGHA